MTELASDAQAVVAAADKKGVPQDYLLTILLLTRDAQILTGKVGRSGSSCDPQRSRPEGNR